jgi:lipoprotein-anchoring transpeptidase ErfK/SrfK
MARSYSVQQQSQSKQIVALLLLLILLLTSACGGNAQIRQQATASQTRFQKLYQYAQQIGVPATMLAPIQQQAHTLQTQHPPFSLFSNKPIDNFYHASDQHYAHLTTQLQQIITISPSLMRTQTRKMLSDTNTLLQQQKKQELPAQNFATQFQQLQQRLPKAQLPKDYTAIDNDAVNLQHTLQQLGTLKQQLAALNTDITLLQDAKLNASAIQTAYHADQQAYAKVQSDADVQALLQHIDIQRQQGETGLLHNSSTIAHSKLAALQQQIQKMPVYHIDPAPYQKSYTRDQQLAQPDLNIQSYQTFIKQVNTDLTQAETTVLQAEGKQTLQQFHQEAQSWGNAHAYHDKYDGKKYLLDAGYLDDGIGSDLDTAFTQATTLPALRQSVNQINEELFNLRMMEKDTNDKTPYDRPHATDMQILQHYHLSGQVIIISLAQQALRLYQNGKLVRAYQVTTGRAELPSPPGIWSVQNKLSPTEFRSSEPESSPYWYPPTHINYAILFHDGGYFIHDATWRYNYGPYTQFPHYDDSGDQRSSGNGSHGCVNLPLDKAEWLYNHTDWKTSIALY